MERWRPTSNSGKAEKKNYETSAKFCYKIRGNNRNTNFMKISTTHDISKAVKIYLRTNKDSHKGAASSSRGLRLGADLISATCAICTIWRGPGTPRPALTADVDIWMPSTFIGCFNCLFVCLMTTCDSQLVGTWVSRVILEAHGSWHDGNLGSPFLPIAQANVFHACTSWWSSNRLPCFDRCSGL